MSNAGNQPSHRLVAGAPFITRALFAGVQFHQPIKIDGPQGITLASKLAGTIDVRKINLGETEWNFSNQTGASPAGQCKVAVQEQRVSLEAASPTDRRQIFEDKYGVVLKEFGKLLRPQLMLSSAAIIRGTIQVDGDARQYLMQHVAAVDAGRLNRFGRPVHLFGIRLLLPPYQQTPPIPAQRKGKKTVPAVPPVIEKSVIDVKAESLVEDPTQLYIDAKIEWTDPVAWSDASIATAVGRIEQVAEFIDKTFRPFLDNGSPEGN